MIERRYFVQDRPIGFTLRGLLKVICPRLRQGISACLESKRMGFVPWFAPPFSRVSYETADHSTDADSNRS
jgi:hypothetical protein